MDTLGYTLNAILPILLIVAAGFVVKRLGDWDDDFFRKLNSLCFHFFLPIQIFMSVYTVESIDGINWRVLGFILMSIFLSLIIGILATLRHPRDPKQRAIVVQASFRSNQAILGLPLASALGGEAAMGFASMTTSLTVPLFNILGVIVLTIGGSGSLAAIKPGKLVKKLVSNPLIIAGLLGFAAVLLKEIVPSADGLLEKHLWIVYDALDKLKAVASPMMLFVLGARFELAAVRRLLPEIAFGTLLRLVVCPVIVIALAIGLGERLGLSALEMPSVIASMATPAAVSGATMACELGCDDQLASQMVVWTTLCSAVSIFCFVFVLRALGFL